MYILFSYCGDCNKIFVNFLFKMKFEFRFELLNIFLRFLYINKKDVKIEIKKWRNSSDSGRIN